jgi:hypothetical protein
VRNESKSRLTAQSSASIGAAKFWYVPNLIGLAIIGAESQIHPDSKVKSPPQTSQLR